ncbi:MAG TPA: hypothetical protein VIK84_00870 [Haloplasmataceae bacterium]
MKKPLSKKQMNYILLQMVAITYACVLLLADEYIGKNFMMLKIGIYAFLFITVVIYEIVIHILFKKALKRQHNNEQKESNLSNNEKFLWFELLLLLDVLIIVTLIHSITRIHVAILLVSGFFLFYCISMLIKPYFDIKNSK